MPETACPPPRISGDLSTLPPRGAPGCDCNTPAPADAFILLTAASGALLWYAKKTCPTHGLKTSAPVPAAPPSTPIVTRTCTTGS